MEKNKVKLTICGAEYIIGSDEDSKYMIELGDEVDEKISTILKQNPRISVTQAAVLAALEFADAEKKAVVSAENLRSKIQEYLEDSARAKTDREIAMREADRLAKELAAYKKKHSSHDAYAGDTCACGLFRFADRSRALRGRRRIPRRTGVERAPQCRKFQQ